MTQKIPELRQSVPLLGQAVAEPAVSEEAHKLAGPTQGPRVRKECRLQTQKTACYQAVSCCGPGWDRTSDLPRVKRTLSH